MEKRREWIWKSPHGCELRPPPSFLLIKHHHHLSVPSEINSSVYICAIPLVSMLAAVRKERESLTFNACSIPSISRAPIPAATVSRTSLQLSSLPFIELPAFSFELCDARVDDDSFPILMHRISPYTEYSIPFEIHNIDPSDAPEVKVFHVASSVVCARGRMCLHGNLLSYFNEL